MQTPNSAKKFAELITEMLKEHSKFRPIADKTYKLKAKFTFVEDPKTKETMLKVKSLDVSSS
jgi:hypothetical protein